MFIGEAMCLVVYYLNLFVERQQQRVEQSADENTSSNRIVAQETPTIGNNSSEITPLLIPPTGAASTLATKMIPLEGWSTLLLWLPTLCDLVATSLMNVGLLFISASIYQMLRGSVVLFSK